LSMEVRRIQRLGTSSLVVTLPKEWARRLGLKPGSQVILIDDGNSIRILPMDHETPKGVHIDLSKFSPPIAYAAPYCIYISGYDSVTFKVPDPDKSIQIIKKKAHSFMGMEVFEVSDDELKLEILIDMKRIEFNRLFKTMSITMSRVARVLRRAITEGTREAMDELKFLQEDFLRTLYLALRYLSSNSIKMSRQGPSTASLYIAMAANYTGLIVDMLNEFIRVSGRLNLNKLTELEKDEILKIIDALEKAGSLELRLIANPSVKRLGELMQLLKETKEKIEELLGEVDSAVAGLLLGKLHDAIRLLMISSYVLTCKIIFNIDHK